MKRRLGRGTRVAAMAGVAAVAMTGLTGCGVPRSDVGVVGDSLTVQIAPSLAEATGPTRLKIAAVPGATVGDMVDDAREVARSRPEVLVVNLGSNDVLGGVPPEQSAADLRRLLGQFTGVRCVILVSVNETMESPVEGVLTDRAVATNAQLAEVATAEGAVVIDWNAVLEVERAEPSTPDMLIDTIHVSGYGVEVLTAVYLDAISTGCSANGGADL